MTWDDAKYWCEIRAGVLLNGNDDAVWNVLTSTTNGFGDVWTGLTNQGGADCVNDQCVGKLRW